MPQIFKANGQDKVKYVGHIAPHIYLALKRVASENGITLGTLLEKLAETHEMTNEVVGFYLNRKNENNKKVQSYDI